MGHRARPHYREDRGHWYCQIGGKQVILAHGAKADTEREAQRRFHEAMARHASEQPGAFLTAGALVGLYLARCRRERLTAEAIRSYRGLLEDFAAGLGKRPADQVRPADVSAWIARRMVANDRPARPGRRRTGGQAASTLSHYVGVVKMAWTWGLKEGLLAANPLALVRVGSTDQRQTVMTMAQYRAAIGLAGPELAALLEMCLETGARPITVRMLEAREIRWNEGRAVVAEHKTRKKTHRPLVVYLSARALELCRLGADRWPAGPIFRRPGGLPWSNGELSRSMRPIQEALGLPKGTGPSSGRHLLATDALEQGVPTATVAAILGHTSVAMVARHYAHLASRGDHLREVVERIRPAQPKASEPDEGQAERVPEPSPL